MKKLILSMLCAVMVFSTACKADTHPEPEATTPAQQATSYKVDVLRLEGGKDWGAPNPYLHASRGPGNAKKDFVFASMLEADEKGVIGWMAESWKVEDNDYYFTLRKDNKFHDGTPLTANDVAFTIDYYKQFPPVSNSLGHGESFIVKDYEVMDDYNIKISVDKSDATTLTSLGGFEILPKHIWETITDPNTYNEEDAFIGSGAYKFSSYDGATGSYEFVAFDDFAAAKPAAGKVQFVPVSDSILAFENGDIDITSLPADLYEKYSSDEKYGLVAKENDMGYKLLINFETRPEFLDIQYRKEIYSALDRQAVVDKVFRGNGSVASAGYAPAGSIYFNEDCIKYPYLPEEAKEFFKDKNISINIVAGNSGNDVKIAELIKLDLEAAGIAVTVSAYDNAVRDDMVNSGDYEFALVGNGGWGGRAPAYLRTIFSDISKNGGGNPHSMGPRGYSSEIITELAEAQKDETDFEKRIQIFKDLQMEISKEIPLIVVANQTSYSVFNKEYYDEWTKTYDYQQAEQIRLSYIER